MARTRGRKAWGRKHLPPVPAPPHPRPQPLARRPPRGNPDARSPQNLGKLYDFPCPETSFHSDDTYQQHPDLVLSGEGWRLGEGVDSCLRAWAQEFLESPAGPGELGSPVLTPGLALG